MSGPGGISSNRPVNTGYTAPTQGAGQAKEPGMDLVQDLVLGGKVRTAQAQPPGKPFTETMGAAFSAMGAAVTNFFKGLGDRLASIELPSLPRISLRRQETVQAEAAAPQRPTDPFEAAMDGKPVSAKVRADFTAFAQFAATHIKEPQTIVRHILSLPEGNAVAKAYDDLATQRMDRPNLDFMKALRSEEGLSLPHFASNFVADGAQQLNLGSRLREAILNTAEKLSESGVNDLSFRQVPAASGSGFEIEVSSSTDDGASGPDTAALKSQLANLVNQAQKSVIGEMGTQLKQAQGGGLMAYENTYPQQKLFKAGMAAVAENKLNAENMGANTQAEIGELNGMSTPEFAEALRADPSLARHLPQMNPSSPARQEYENFVAQDPSMSRQAATEGFYEMVKQSLIHESLIENGLVKEEPADNAEAEPDFSDIAGIGTTGSVPTGAASGLPQVALASLGHLFKLGDNNLTPEQMNRLDAHLKAEYSSENMSFLRSGAALMNIQAADGSTRPVDNANLKAGESVKLTADLPVIKQWAAHFVGNDAAEQVNVQGRQMIALESALSNMPDDAATATDAQKQALAGAMKDCFAEIANMVTRDSLPRAFA